MTSARGDIASLPRTVAGTTTLWTESVDSFLVEMARVSRSRGEAHRQAEVSSGTVVAQRYKLMRPLGRGGHGIVWVAEDAVSSCQVAVKLLLVGSPDQAARVRAEIVSLRTARSCGVVPLLDEGVEGSLVFIVMPIVEGAPFPGCRTPAAWPALEPVAIQLLEKLQRVHEIGIIHRDLKPANVLVDGRGGVILLDFGVSLPPLAVDPTESMRLVGTPAYLSPEQVALGMIDARADLYSVGVMLYEALEGRLPHRGNDVRAILEAKRERLPPLRAAVLDLPERVAQTVDSLLAVDPRDRPGSARDAIRMLLGAPSSPAFSSRLRRGPLAAGRSRPLSDRGLRRLFSDPDQGGFAAREAAAFLLARTSGDPARVRVEIDAWLRDGTVRADPQSGRYAIDRGFLDRHRARHLLVTSIAGSSVESLLREVRGSARTGATRLAVALLLVFLSRGHRTKRACEPHELDDVLSLAVEIALVDGSADVVDAVLYELCRIGPRSRRIEYLEALVRAHLSIGPWTDRALTLASGLPSFPEVGLDLLRHSIRVIAARRTSVAQEAAVVSEIGAWAAAHRDPVVAGTHAGWLGRLCYRQGDYRRAAELHVRAGRAPLWATLKARSWMNAASAFMEAFDLAEAARWAAASSRLYVRCGHAVGHAESRWFRRLLEYRRGDILEPDPRRIESVAHLGRRELEGLACVTEAAIAWRSDRADRLELAGSLAQRALATWRSMGETAGALLLSAALAVHCGAREAPPADVGDLVARASCCDTPGVGIQALALLAAHRGGRRDPGLERRLAEQVPRAHWSRRIDVLSVDESLAMLAAAAPTPALSLR